MRGTMQGSILGPQLFAMYIQPIAAIISQHNLQGQLYADDIQLYTTVDPGETLTAAFARIGACIDAVHVWLESNGLKLNNSRIDVITFGRDRANAGRVVTLQVVGSQVESVPLVRDLGVHLDCAL